MSDPTFIDTRFSDAVSYGFSGGPNWNTLVEQLKNGATERNTEWDFPLHSFRADYSVLTDDEQDEVLAAFWVARGAWASFRYKDWNDYRVKPGQGPLPVPSPGTAPIQLTKTYTFGPTTYLRTILLPTVVALYFDAGSGPVLFTDYTVDPLTGLCTPDITWPEGTPSWIGEFDVRVRFSKDFNPFTRARPKVSTCMVELEEDPL